MSLFRNGILVLIISMVQSLCRPPNRSLKLATFTGYTIHWYATPSDPVAEALHVALSTD